MKFVASPRKPWTATWSLAEVSRKTSLEARSVRWNVAKFPRLAKMDEAEVVHFLQLAAKDRKLAADAWDEHERKERDKTNSAIFTIKPTAPAPAKGKRKGKADKPADEKPGSGGFGICMDLPAGFGEGMGLRIEVEKLKQASAAARALWFDLVSTGHRDTAKAFAVWQQLLAAWTKLAKDAPAALTALDDSISREVHEKTIGATLQAVDRVLAGLPAKIAASGQRLESRALQAICESEIEAARDALYSGKALSDEADLINEIQGHEK